MSTVCTVTREPDVDLDIQALFRSAWRGQMTRDPERRLRLARTKALCRRLEYLVPTYDSVSGDIIDANYRLMFAVLIRTIQDLSVRPPLVNEGDASRARQYLTQKQVYAAEVLGIDSDYLRELLRKMELL